MNRIGRYFLDLGFYPTEIELGQGLARRRIAWSIVAYTLLFVGLFAQQTIDVKSVPARVHRPDVSVLLVSIVVSLALFPPFTHWFNSKLKVPSWEHVLWAFSFGFFFPFSVDGVLKFAFR
jgi:hypothetical protein